MVSGRVDMRGRCIPMCNDDAFKKDIILSLWWPIASYEYFSMGCVANIKDKVNESPDVSSVGFFRADL